MKTILDIISSTPLFNGLPEHQLREIAGIAVKRNFKKGETIFSEGDNGNGFYVVASGNVKIFKVSSEGKEHILHIFGVGEPFGEVPVFTHKPFPASAQSITDSRLLFFPKDRFIALITAHPSLSLNMLAVLSMRLKQFTVQIENLSLKEVPSRLASYLIVLSEEQQNPEFVTLTISKGQLASLIGTIPETLSRIFAKLAQQNIIQVKGKTIHLMNYSSLEELAVSGRSYLNSDTSGTTSSVSFKKEDKISNSIG